MQHRPRPPGPRPPGRPSGGIRRGCRSQGAPRPPGTSAVSDARSTALPDPDGTVPRQPCEHPRGRDAAPHRPLPVRCLHLQGSSEQSLRCAQGGSVRRRRNRTSPGRRPKKSVPELIVHTANRLNEKRMIFSRVVFHQREAPTGYGTSGAGGRRRRSAPSAVPGIAYSARRHVRGRSLEVSVIACHPLHRRSPPPGGFEIGPPRRCRTPSPIPCWRRGPGVVRLTSLRGCPRTTGRDRNRRTRRHPGGHRRTDRTRPGRRLRRGRHGVRLHPHHHERLTQAPPVTSDQDARELDFPIHRMWLFLGGGHRFSEDPGRPVATLVYRWTTSGGTHGMMSPANSRAGTDVSRCVPGPLRWRTIAPHGVRRRSGARTRG